MQRAGGIPRAIILILALALGTLATQSLVAQETAQELVAIANNASDPPRQTWALYELKDRFPQEPVVVELFIRIAGDTNANFLNCLVAIQGLRLSGNKEAAALAAMRAIMQRAISQIGGGSDEQALAKEAIEMIAAIGPLAYPASVTLVAIVTNKTSWLPLRHAATRALAAIGPAAQNTAPQLELIFLNTQEDMQLRVEATEALARIGCLSIRVFEMLGNLILSRPPPPQKELGAFVNAYAAIGSVVATNDMGRLSRCRVRLLHETSTEVARVIRGFGDVLRPTDTRKVEATIAKLEAERARRPCNDICFLFYKVYLANPVLCCVAAVLFAALLGFAVLSQRRRLGRCFSHLWGKLAARAPLPAPPPVPARASGQYDVFLSHNSKDKPAVRELKRRLVAQGLSVWHDEDQLRPGIPWLQLLEDGIKASKSVAVLVDKDGLGPWEDEEMQTALRLAAKDKRPVIPVLLPGVSTQPELPVFLVNRTWVDLRSGFSDEGFERLRWGITGNKSGDALGGETNQITPVADSGNFGGTATTPPPEGQERRRRIDAAAPAYAALGTTIDLLVQVRMPDSPELGKKDFPVAKPYGVVTDSHETALIFPVDAQTGQTRPAKLRVRVVAPDFVVESLSEVTLKVPPEGNSDLLTFLLKTQKLGHCRVNVEILTDGGEHVGTIPVSTLVNGGVSQPEWKAMSLVLVVVVSSKGPRVVPADPSAIHKEPEGKTPSTPEIDYHDAHKEVLAKALVRLGLLEPNQELPDPYRTATGVQGKSQVHFLFLPRGGSGISLVAKFDEPERSDKEWQAIGQLRHLNTPPEAMLPVGNNDRADGVIIYRDAAGATLNGNVIDLKDLLLRQLMANPRNCVTALEKTFDGLALFYRSEPGTARLDQEGHVLRWREVFPNIAPKLDDIEKTIHDKWRKVNWFVDRWILPSATATSGKSLPNPFYRDPGSRETVIERWLAQLTGPVMLSRVHGDLNLTNILINLDAQHRPNRIFIIDLSHCEDNKVTAADFARMESEFWHEPIIGLVDDDSEDRKMDRLFQTFVAVRDCLDGRRDRLSESASPLERHCLQFVCQLRQRAITTLRGNQDNYCLNDYFVCLFFRHIAALTFPSVTGDKHKVLMAVLGAALALQMLEDLEAGRYSEGAVNRLHSPIRPCEEMLPPELPPTTRMQINKP